jgi:hypothetical protein
MIFLLLLNINNEKDTHIITIITRDRERERELRK